MTDPATIERLEELNAKRTPGEWVYKHLEIHPDIRQKGDNATDAWNEVHAVGDDPYKTICGFASTRGSYWQEEANGKFVAEMANNAASLLSDAKLAAAYKAEAEAFWDWEQNCCGGCECGREDGLCSRWGVMHEARTARLALEQEQTR